MIFTDFNNIDDCIISNPATCMDKPIKSSITSEYCVCISYLIVFNDSNAMIMCTLFLLFCLFLASGHLVINMFP